MYKSFFCFALSILLSTLCNAQKFIEEEKKLIVGRWLTEDKSSTYAFGKDSTCKVYRGGNLSEVYKYKIVFLNSYCHKESKNSFTLEEAELEELSYLELVGNDGIRLCFEVNGVTKTTLSISPLSQPTPILFNRVLTTKKK